METQNTNMNQVPTRRELRRRKILENSANRLQKISNINRENVDLLNVGTNFRDISVDTRSNKGNDDDESARNEEEQLYTLFQSRRTLNSSQSSSVNIAFVSNRHRLCYIIFVALLVKFINYACAPNKFFIPLLHLDVRAVFVDRIFVPVFLYELFDSFVLRNSISDTSFVQSLLLFANLSHKTALIISYIVNVSIKVAQDLLAYLFVFVITDLCKYIVQRKLFF